MRLNSRKDLKRTRSTKAPVIRAGVITANIIWKAANSAVGNGLGVIRVGEAAPRR